MKNLFTKFLIVLLMLSCNKEDESSAADSCIELEKSMQGIYSVEIKTYPLQPSVEGRIEDARISFDFNCYTDPNGDKKTVTIHELFDNYCLELPYLDDGKFEIKISDDVYWWGAIIRGNGIITNNQFSFNGKVFSRFDSDTIILKSNNFTSANNYCN